MNEPYRSIFTHLAGKDMSLAEIAEQLGLKTSGIYNQYARGLQHLRRILGVRQEPPG